MAFIQTNVPLVFWGRSPPAHEITCICKTEEKKGLATGSLTGQVCLWEVCKERDTEKVKLRARCLLFGGKSAIIDICFVRNWQGERDHIATLSSKGTISMWDGKDGACLKFTTIERKHCGIKSLPRAKYSDTLLVLYGKYSEVYILDSETLDVLCHLQETHNPNWIARLCFLSNIEKKEAVLSVSVDKVAKHWLLPSRSEMKEVGSIFEEKSQTLGLTSPPLSLTSYSYQNTHSTVLVVCKEAWQLYDATGGKMKLLMINPCEASVEGWMKGEILDHHTLIAWSAGDGRAFVYKLSASCVPGITESQQEDSTAGCSILCVLGQPSPLHPSPSVYIDRYWHVQGDKAGTLYLWDLRKILANPLVHDNKADPHHSPVPHDTVCALSDSWDPPALPSGLTDTLYPDSTPPIVTCAVYLTSFGRLVCGQADGSIAILSALQAATVLMLQPRRFSRGWPKHCILRGHKGHVTCLIYPSSHSKAYDRDLLLSGGADFTVKLWSLFSGDHQHTFAVNGGKIRDIVSCPPDINPRLQTCVCSIAEDYSVAILSTSERKCLLVAACHSAPVNTVHWRLDEDFLLVSCTDGCLYVWQIETGSLDRCVDGETARTILSTVPDTPYHTPSLQQITPLYVRSLSTGSNNPLIQILLFDPHQLILGLSKMEKLSRDVPQKKALKEADALRSYIYARRHFAAGGVGGGAKRPSVSSSSGSRSMAVTLPGVALGQDTSRLKERAREVLGQGVANQNKAENVQEESPHTIIDIIRLMLSCLHAWRLDEELDQSCEEVLGLVRPSKPVSFGLLSKGGCMSLVLPGWGLRTRLQRLDSIIPGPDKEISEIELSLESPDGFEKISSSPKLTYTFDQKYHLRWQCSRALTTQHLLTMVSITNTLMNQTIGAHHLATSSGMKQMRLHEDSDSDGEDNTVWDNQIRAVWSRVAALHCVMLPERMEGKFRPPYLPVLASRFLDPCQAIREASQALLQAELRRIGLKGRRELVKEWATNLQVPTNTSSAARWEGSRTRYSEERDMESGPTPTSQQHATALIILGMIGAEFHEGDRTPQAKRKHHQDPHHHRPGERRVESVEVMDPGVARRTGKTLQRVLLEKPHSKSTLHSNLRCSAAELLGRGFQLWEKYIDIPQVVMALLDLVLQHSSLRQTSGGDSEPSKKLLSSRSIKFTSEVARKALNLMIILRPVTMVNTLAKEVSSFLASQHVTHFPHSSVQPVQVGTSPPPNTAGIVTPPERLLPASKEEILDLMRTVIEKSQQKLALQLLEVVDIVLFCLDQDSLKKRNVLEIFPSFSRILNISYSSKSKRLAVGARNGQIAIYDLKQSRTQMLNAHTHAVTVLQFSDDGKLLATYAYADSMLHVWQISSTMFGISQTPKLVHSWPAISSGTPLSGSHGNFVRLEWVGSRTITLHMPGGVECKFSI